MENIEWFSAAEGCTLDTLYPEDFMNFLLFVLR
jgi:hypothetical protein